MLNVSIYTASPIAWSIFFMAELYIYFRPRLRRSSFRTFFGAKIDKDNARWSDLYGLLLLKEILYDGSFTPRGVVPFGQLLFDGKRRSNERSGLLMRYGSGNGVLRPVTENIDFSERFFSGNLLEILSGENALTPILSVPPVNGEHAEILEAIGKIFPTGTIHDKIGLTVHDYGSSVSPTQIKRKRVALSLLVKGNLTGFIRFYSELTRYRCKVVAEIVGVSLRTETAFPDLILAEIANGLNDRFCGVIARIFSLLSNALRYAGRNIGKKKSSEIYFEMLRYASALVTVYYILAEFTDRYYGKSIGRERKPKISGSVSVYGSDDDFTSADRIAAVIEFVGKTFGKYPYSNFGYGKRDGGRDLRLAYINGIIQSLIYRYCVELVDFFLKTGDMWNVFREAVKLKKILAGENSEKLDSVPSAGVYIRRNLIYGALLIGCSFIFMGLILPAAAHIFAVYLLTPAVIILVISITRKGNDNFLRGWSSRDV